MGDPYRELRGFQFVRERSSEPQQLGKVISELVALKGLARVQGVEQLQTAWQTIAGDEIARNSRAIEISRSTLIVGVASSALLNELAGFHKATLLDRLQTEFPHLKVRDIKFRLKTTERARST